MPVIYVMFDGRGTCLSEDIPEADDPVPGLLPRLDGEPEVHKTSMNSFNGTGLSDILRGRGRDGILICGLVAHYCVLATYFGAFDHGIAPYLLEGGVAATDKRNVAMVEHLFRTLSVEDIPSLARP